MIRIPMLLFLDIGGIFNFIDLYQLPPEIFYTPELMTLFNRTNVNQTGKRSWNCNVYRYLHYSAGFSQDLYAYLV